MQEQRGAFAGLGFVGKDADGAVGLEAVDDACAGGHADAQAFVADGHAPVGADFERGAQALDIRPPGTTREGALGGAGGGVGGALEFAMDFVGVAESGRSALAAAGVVMVSAAKRAGRRPCQYWCWRSILPLAWGVRA